MNTSSPSSSRRATRQRAAIHEALRCTGGFRTAQQLHDELKGVGERVGLTTVYRELQALAGAGEVDALRNVAGETMYRLCQTDDHHHHVVCRSCGVTVEVHSDEIEDWAARTAARHGFTDIAHTAELYGLCPRCA
jgi:Fur family transcriptional regulator, ferric uptake regulator